MTKQEFFKHINELALNRYSLLDRMHGDCQYVIHACSCDPSAFKFLWAGNPVEQIAYMRYLWESFPVSDRPDWINAETIDKYERLLILENKKYKPLSCMSCVHYDGYHCRKDNEDTSPYDYCKEHETYEEE